MRLNLFISKSGYASRRKADILIKQGKVKVNGQVVIEPFFQVSENDEIDINDSEIFLKKHIYILFNKPKGVTTTLSDKFAQKKITAFFPAHFFARKVRNSEKKKLILEDKGIYPVGRLDKQSRGLIILTNDGDLCYKVTHPKFAIEKEYLINIKGQIKEKDCLILRKGIIDNEDYLKIDSISILQREKDKTICKVIVREGKKRHLRRLFKKIGFPIDDLKRIRIGNVCLGNLKSGKYELISEKKLKAQLNI